MEIDKIEKQLDKIEKRIEEQEKALEEKRKNRTIFNVVCIIIFGLSFILSVAEIILGGPLL